MPKKTLFQNTFDSQHIKKPKTLLKSARRSFYHVFKSLLQKLNWKMSMILIFEILEFLVQILTADDKYSLLIETIYRNQFICNYLRKKSFPLFSSPIL